MITQRTQIHGENLLLWKVFFFLSDNDWISISIYFFLSLSVSTWFMSFVSHFLMNINQRDLISMVKQVSSLINRIEIEREEKKKMKKSFHDNHDADKLWFCFIITELKSRWNTKWLHSVGSGLKMLYQLNPMENETSNMIS